MAERLGVSEPKLRPYTDAAPPEYWGAVRVQGRLAYHPESEGKFRAALEFTPSRFRQMVAEEGGGTAAALAATQRVNDSLSPQQALILAEGLEVTVGAMREAAAQLAATQRVIDSASRAALPAPEDALLDRKEAAAMLRCAEASVGRFVKAFRARPFAVWRRSDLYRYMQTGERQR